VPVLIAIVVVGFLATAVGGAWLWQRQVMLAAADDTSRVAGLERQVADLSRRAAADPTRVAALDAEVAALRLRLTTLEQRPTPAPADLVPLTGRVGAVEGAASAIGGRVDALEKRFAELDQRAQSATGEATRTAALQAAARALEAGKPLGPIPGAPPALARFAAQPPPTEASLRLAFPAAAAAAEQASLPGADGLSLPQRMWQQVQALITVRQGERVLVGAPASRVLAEARIALDAGDLAGTVAALDRLDPAAAKAMADWRGQAVALLDARTALAGMARS
jgi:hypothetical protein